MTEKNEKIQYDEAIQRLSNLKSKADETLEFLKRIKDDNDLSDVEKFDKTIDLIRSISEYEPQGDIDE